MLGHLDLGRRGEECATEHLRSIGYQIVERNKRYALGEIDILARDGQTLVIVEVKSGKTGKFGQAILRVGSQKQRKLRLLAARLSQEYPHANLRIDLMNVDENGRVTHLVSAIEA